MHFLQTATEAIEGKGEIRIKTYQDGQTVAVLISDTGVGIPPEQLEHIFDFDFRTVGSRIKMDSGWAMAYHIIEKHKGKIRIESEVGKGTEVIISLPISLPDTF